MSALPITTGADDSMATIAINSIVASRTNPRKIFRPEPLQELADSIKASGVHQPILVRRLPAARLEETAGKQTVHGWPFATTRKAEPIEWELVAGERRWRACQLAGYMRIPALIRELTDDQALEVQVIENLQREDVTELEEAEGYEVLMQGGKLTADQVGAKIGKSRSYVYSRLKVLDLCEGGRLALRAGDIDFSRALLAARIPHEKLQLEAIQWMCLDDYNGDLPGYRECARHIQQTYMLELKTATFPIKDANLLPGAGACTDCPKRTGADRDLFSDVQSADVCTDTKCFHKKAEAHTEQVAQAARDKGQTVIAGKEAEELYGGSSWNRKIVGYRRLDSAEDSPTGEPLRKIIGKQMKGEGIEPTKIENPRKKGELIDALPNDVALRLLKTVEGQAQAAQQVSKEVKAFADEKKAKAAAKAKAQYEAGWRNALLDSTWKELQKNDKAVFTLDVHRYFALRAVKNLSNDDALAVADVLGLGRVGAHAALVEYAKECISPDSLQLLCIMQIDSSPNDHSYGGRIANEGLMLVAGRVFGDGVGDVITSLQLDMADKYLPKPETAPTAAPKPAANAKSKKTAPPAALANDNARGRKTTKAEALADIAAGFAALEAGTNQAPAAQGDEAPAVPDGQPVTNAAPGAAGGADVDAVSAAPAAQGDGEQPAAAAGQQGAALGVDVQVRVLPTATGKKQAPHIGKVGKILRKVGSNAWDVAIPREKRNVPIFIVFDASELEALP